MVVYSIKLFSSGASYDGTGQNFGEVSGSVKGGNFISNWTSAGDGYVLAKQNISNATFVDTLNSMFLTDPTITGKHTFGTTGAAEITQIFTADLTDNTPTTIATIPLDDDSITGFDVDVSGIARTTTDAAQFKLFLAWSRRGGGPTALGSLTSFDPRNTGAPASGWDATLNTSGNDARLVITSDSTLAVRWLAFIKYRVNTLPD